MIDYKKVSKSLAYLIETMNGFSDEVLKYKYSKVLVHYKNYIEEFTKPLTQSIRWTRLYDRIQTMLYGFSTGNHNNYLYFPHLEDECDIILDDTVDVETVSQLQMDLLVRAGMPDYIEAKATDGINVTFRVTSEVAEKYNSLLEFAISEWTLIIAQSE